MNLIIYKKNLFKNSWLYIFLLIPILQPDYFKEITYLDNIYLVAKTIVFFLVSAKYFNTKKVSRFSILLLFLFIPMYISTYISSEPIFYAIKKTIEIVLMSMIVELGLYYRGIKFIEIFYEIMYILVLINFVLLLLFPNGLIQINMNSENYKSYFLSIKNGMISWMILSTCLGLIVNRYYKNKRKKLFFKLLLVIITITMVLTKSSTGLIGWFILISYLLFISRKSLSKYFTLKSLLIIFIVLFILVVLLNVQNYFTFLFELLFNKSGSFTGRTDLWQKAIEFIKQKPLLGYGLREDLIIKSSYGRAYSSHNFILEILLSGGFISLINLSLIFIALNNRRKIFRKNQMLKDISICIFIFLVCTLTESGLYRVQWFTLLTMFYNVKYIIKKSEFNKN